MQDFNQIIQQLSGLGWAVVIAGIVFTATFLIIFVWFASKIFKQFDKDFNSKWFK